MYGSRVMVHVFCSDFVLFLVVAVVVCFVLSIISLLWNFSSLAFYFYSPSLSLLPSSAICLSFCLFDCLAVSLSAGLPVCLYVCLPACLPA